MLDELRLDPAAFARVAAAAKLAVAGLAAGTADDSPRHDLHRGAMRLRARHKLARPADLDAWLRDIGADAAGARRLFAREAGLAALDAAPAQALVDHLRAEGSAAALAARARDKRRKLETAEAARLEPSRLDRESLAEWWRETAGGPARAADAEGYARPLGFRDEDALFAALWRERLYRQQLDANRRAG